MIRFDYDSGLIAIDFEDGNKPVTVARPKMGQFARLRSESVRLQNALPGFRTELLQRAQTIEDARNHPAATDEEKNAAPLDYQGMVDDWIVEQVTAWWLLVLKGNDTFKAMADSPAAVPDPADWPSWLVIGQAGSTSIPMRHDADLRVDVPTKQGIIYAVIEFWRDAPLARGGLLAPQTLNPSENGHSQVLGSMR